jgi:hypothetical protein
MLAIFDHPIASQDPCEFLVKLSLKDRYLALFNKNTGYSLFIRNPLYNGSNPTLDDFYRLPKNLSRDNCSEYLVIFKLRPNMIVKYLSLNDYGDF